jgi:hypothetical protein
MTNENERTSALPEISHIDAIRLYESWVATLNHYSGLVMTIRITAITSGIIILAAAGTLLLKEGKLDACRLVCWFGMAFSAVLCFMLYNYYEHYKDWLKLVSDVEAEIALPRKLQTWTLYKDMREKGRSRYRVWIVRYGSITLIIIASCVIYLSTFFVGVKKSNEKKVGPDIRTSEVNTMNCEVVR